MFFCEPVSIDLSSLDFDDLVDLLSRAANLLEGHSESDDIRYYVKLLQSRKRSALGGKL